MSARRIAVIAAGLSNPSTTRLLADRLSAAVTRELEASGVSVTLDVIELRDHAHDVVNNLLTGFPSPSLESAINTVVSADAVIAVTPIFSTSYSGLFKSFIDVLDPNSLTGKPVLIGANAGTQRHSLAIDYAIRPLFTYLHAAPVPTGVYVASGDWGHSGEAGVDASPLADRIERGARELATAMLAREAITPELDAFDPESYLGAGRSFGHLLGGLAGE